MEEKTHCSSMLEQNTLHFLEAVDWFFGPKRPILRCVGVLRASCELESIDSSTPLLFERELLRSSECHLFLLKREHRAGTDFRERPPKK